jgi:hypothetical protein
MLGACLALALSLPVTSAYADTAPATTDSPTSDVGALVLIGSTVSDEVLSDGLTNCVPGTKTKHAHTTYNDALGNPAFTIYNNVTFSYNCTKVTSISHYAYVDSYSPIYRFGGWIANNDTGSGTPSAEAIAQARVGICTSLVVSGCFLESDPSLNWAVNARGGATAHASGGGA